MLKSLVKNSLFILACTLFVACGKSTEEEVKDAVLSANILLSRKECQPAIDLLEGMGRQNKNANYLKALSSAYACRAGYSTITFFADDISKTASPAPLGGMTLYSTSQVTATSPLTDDSKFRDLQTAIDILSYAGGIASTVEPSSAERLKYFSVNQAGDINTQLAFMVLVQTGKLMKVYSDANSSGVKGGGSGSNNCFTDYTTTDASTVQAYLGLGETGACTSANSSHPQLALGVSGRRKRLCEGVVLLNAILDLLPNIMATAGGGDLDAIKDMTTDIQEKKDELASMDSTYVPTMNVLSQTNCETSTDITEVTLSSYYAVFFESLVK
ncbi:hypothetical protein DOM21_15565 [Bacteriovorax stolpii]|uniref:Uncharacterized protein n=1 Tax=Bacteriovorax stolpii TaxID=960 RepID=A0A2K9NNW8_BACTC|nr:hypothetical protein [Bacteriovorax stolpii]AUN97219.1 hypothetical protein C0V70_03660 [Bacteriovorax stolpii]QDK42842.1 hypothetical protein DOM21_15565 [Bacteriovorax stolpii]TDP53508.1 hypothetical protein C8D79_2152 [Bacteriovorax stolpii]